MLNANSTMLESQLANLTSVQADHQAQEWISGSMIASSLTEKWLSPIEDLDEIATLLNWTYYNHTGGWYVKSVNLKTGQFANHGQFKPFVPLTLDDKPRYCQLNCCQN